MKKRWVDILAILYGLFIVYSSLIPFDFSSRAPSSAHGTFWGIHITDTNLPDVMSNLALYLPLGFLLRASFSRRRMTSTGGVLATFGVVIGLCFGIELLQTFLISRVSSITDCVCDILGAAIGIVLYASESTLTARMVRAMRAELSRDATAFHAGGWAVLTILTALVPLDLTFDPSFLVRAVRRASFVPFGKHGALAEQAQLIAVEPLSQGHFALTELWQLRIDYVADVFMFLVLGMLIARRFGARGYRSVTSMLAASAWTSALGLLISGAGLFVMSVGFDATHILTRTLGGVIGAIFHTHIITMVLRGRHDAPSITRYRRALGVGIAMCVMYISARELAPFGIDTDKALVKMARIEWLPMHAYSLTKLPQAALDAVHKSFRFITLGLLLSLLWIGQRKRIVFRHRFAAGCGAAVGVAGLEFAQCWLPGRVPAVTDVLIAGCMTSGGVVIGEVVYHTYQQMVARVGPERQEPIIFNVELPPVERLGPPRGPQKPERKVHTADPTKS